MKRIKYLYNIPINHGDEENPTWEDCLYPKDLPYSETTEEIAKKEAYKGEYTIEDDGIEDIQEPTKEDKFEAQLTYTAMMTGTLLEEV